MLEAHGRNFWQPDENTLKKLQQLYAETDEELEGVNP
jgi:magnesium chelatase subunit H